MAAGRERKPRDRGKTMTTYNGRVGGANYDPGDLDNSIYGSNLGNDLLYGGPGDDTINCARQGDGADNSGRSDTLYVDDGSDQLLGGHGGDRLFGGAGNDTLYGQNHSDTVSGGAGDDYLVSTHSSGHDRMHRGAGNDTLVSNNKATAGRDSMWGGAGDNLYSVNGDLGQVGQVYESADEGDDTVESDINYTLGSNIENLVLQSGEGHLTGTGNALANRITGNEGDNLLSGAAGDDTLSGGAGNDTLSGGSGADAMSGGGGDDVFIVDDAGDSVADSAGSDTV